MKRFPDVDENVSRSDVLYLRALNPPMGKLGGYKSMLVRGGAPARSGVELFCLNVGEGRSLLRLERRECNRHKSETAITGEGWRCNLIVRFHFFYTH